MESLLQNFVWFLASSIDEPVGIYLILVVLLILLVLRSHSMTGIIDNVRNAVSTSTTVIIVHIHHVWESFSSARNLRIIHRWCQVRHRHWDLHAVYSFV